LFGKGERDKKKKGNRKWMRKRKKPVISTTVGERKKPVLPIRLKTKNKGEKR